LSCTVVVRRPIGQTICHRKYNIILCVLQCPCTATHRYYTYNVFTKSICNDLNNNLITLSRLLCTENGECKIHEIFIIHGRCESYHILHSAGVFPSPTAVRCRGEGEIDFSKQKWRLYLLVMGTSVHRLDSNAVMTLMTDSALKQKHSVVVAGWKAGYTRKVVRPGDSYIYIYIYIHVLCITEIRLCGEYSDQTVFLTRLGVLH